MSINDLELKQVVLDKIRLCLLTKLSNHGLNFLAENMKFEGISEELDMFSEDIYMRFETCVLGKEHENIIEFPSNWKEAFKQRWFPDWLLNRYPVKMIKISAREVYPYLNPKIKDKQRFVHLYTHTED